MFKPLPTATIQALMTEARHLDAKPPGRHDMTTWSRHRSLVNTYGLGFTSSCGTTSCALGDIAARGDCGLHLEASSHLIQGPFQTVAMMVTDVKTGHVGFRAAENALGITRTEAEFLFQSHWDVKMAHGKALPPRRPNRALELPKQTAARIRKYLYYRMRKAEILADYEKARRTEGNWNVCQDAKRMSTPELAANS